MLANGATNSRARCFPTGSRAVRIERGSVVAAVHQDSLTGDPPAVGGQNFTIEAIIVDIRELVAHGLRICGYAMRSLSPRRRKNGVSIRPGPVLPNLLTRGLQQPQREVHGRFATGISGYPSVKAAKVVTS